jgi:hypothetical protein
MLIQGNPYVGQDQIGANKFIINKVKVLNHRLILILVMGVGGSIVKYFVNDDQTITFEINQSLCIK